MSPRDRINLSIGAIESIRELFASSADIPNHKVMLDANNFVCLLDGILDEMKDASDDLEDQLTALAQAPRRSPQRVWCGFPSPSPLAADDEAVRSA